MKRVKTDWRNRLNPQTLSQLMMVKLSGPDLSSFDPEPAISQWWKEGLRSRRPASRPYGPRAVPDDASDDSASDTDDDSD